MTGQTTTQFGATVFDAVIASLKGAAAYNRGDVERPAAILWPDEKREWETLVPRLRMVLPQFLIFGPYDRTNRSGPTIWLRCVLAGRIPGARLEVVDGGHLFLLTHAADTAARVDAFLDVPQTSSR